jgi:hypothetical protein
MPTLKQTQKMRAIAEAKKATRSKNLHLRLKPVERARYDLAVGKTKPSVSGLSDLVRRLLDEHCERLGIPENP